MGETAAAADLEGDQRVGWNLTLTILAIGMPTVLYTLHGGVQAVTWTDVKQMVVIVLGVLAAVVALVLGLPEDVSFVSALEVAGTAGRLKGADLRGRGWHGPVRLRDGGVPQADPVLQSAQWPWSCGTRTSTVAVPALPAASTLTTTSV